jgi:hypothetical protein
MLTVELTSVEGSTHEALTPDNVPIRTTKDSKHWRMAPSPDRAASLLPCPKSGAGNQQA